MFKNLQYGFLINDINPEYDDDDYDDDSDDDSSYFKILKLISWLNKYNQRKTCESKILKKIQKIFKKKLKKN